MRYELKLYIQFRFVRGKQKFQKPSSHFKILGARTVKRSQLHTEGLQILGGTEQNLVVVAIYTVRFVQPWVL